MYSKKIEYYDNETLLEGYLAYDDYAKAKRPAVLVCHDWSGRNEFAEKKAEKLAELGYIGFAIDMYGKGKLGRNNEEKSKLMQPIVENRSLLRQRIKAGFNTLSAMENVDKNKIGAIGFCFGGLCVLDLARSGADIQGVVSFHGFMHKPENLANEKIKAKILVLHGYDDPMATPSQLKDFASEMSAAQVDWQVHFFSNTMHAFTNPLANDPNIGLMYNKTADRRSWVMMQEFFKEVLS